MSVHGIDDESSPLTCGTFWSAKGIQARIVIVCLPKNAPRNPTYVALTRSFERLIVVLDPKEPHSAFCHAAEMHPESCIFYDDHTLRVVKRGVVQSAEESLIKSLKFVGSHSTTGRNMDRFIPKRERVRETVGMETIYGTWRDVKVANSFSSDMISVAVRMGLVRCELLSTRTVRHIEDILHPTRLDSEQVSQSIRKGLISRWITRNTVEGSLLAPDLKTCIKASYERCKECKDDIPLDDLCNTGSWMSGMGRF